MKNIKKAIIAVIIILSFILALVAIPVIIDSCSYSIKIEHVDRVNQIEFFEDREISKNAIYADGRVIKKRKEITSNRWILSDG